MVGGLVVDDWLRDDWWVGLPWEMVGGELYRWDRSREMNDDPEWGNHIIITISHVCFQRNSEL